MKKTDNNKKKHTLNDNFWFHFQGGNSVPRNSFQGSAPPHLKGPQQRPSTTAAMTSPAGAISNATYRSGTWQTQYPPSQQAYRYSAPLAQPAYAYTQHTASTTVSKYLFYASTNFSLIE
jgi:hypothetical protein